MEHYAEQCQAQLLVVDNQPYSPRRARIERYRVGHLLEEYERVLYLDDTCFISPRCPDVFELVPPDQLGAVIEPLEFYPGHLEYINKILKDYNINVEMDKNTYAYFNAGLMLASRGHEKMFQYPEDLNGRVQNYFNAMRFKYNIPLFDLGLPFNYFGSLIRKNVKEAVRKMAEIHIYHLTRGLGNSALRLKVATQLDQKSKEIAAVQTRALIALASSISAADTPESEAAVPNRAVYQEVLSELRTMRQQQEFVTQSLHDINRTVRHEFRRLDASMPLLRSLQPQKSSLNRPPLIEDTQAIFLYHMRKAGGTSLRRYCEKLSSAKSLDYRAVEGRSLDYKKFFQPDQKTVHITSLREPLARLKSMYRFEGRWPRGEKGRSAANAKLFATWINEILRYHAEPKLLNICLINYYVKALIGYPRHSTIGQAEFDLAKRRLESFEIVLITEWFNTPATTRYLQRELKWTTGLPHLNLTPPVGLSPEESETGLFDPATLQALEAANAWDSKLYDFAQQLVRDRLGIPQQDPSLEPLLDEVKRLRRRAAMLKARASQ